MSKNKNKVGVVYSTNPDFQYQFDDDSSPVETLPPSSQHLHLRMERSGRGGKTVTVVSGFVGTDEDLALLGKTLKNKLGTGGSAKDGEIIIQGEHRQQISDILKGLGYKV